MAVGEKRNINQISQVSWTDGTAMDVYYWLANSFQYSANINTDDEMHWIKLSTRAMFTDKYKKCQLVSLWSHWVMALPVDTDDVHDEVTLKRFECNWYDATHQFEELNDNAGTTFRYDYDAVPWVVFQDRFWFWYNRGWSSYWYISSVKCDSVSYATRNQMDYLPFDHNDYTDEEIETPAPITNDKMMWRITAILNYNNTRLVVAAWQDLWVYYPGLDHWWQATVWDKEYYWTEWWKKVLTYEAWVTIVGLTCTFEYLKVWAVDEWWNTKVYYYQGNNNLRSTFVYNVADLTWVRVLHVYSINGIDYYTSSIAEYAQDALIDFNKMIWATPVKLFSQRAWMTQLDINTKAPYFVWPTSISWAYNNWHIYVADAYGIFSFKYDPQWFDKWYMKWKLRASNTYIDWWVEKPIQIYWLCENKWFLYVSDSEWCRAVRLYDTWIDWYQQSWILISREYEWEEWWTITKMLDEIRLNYELNPNTTHNWSIDIYVSPNNLWKDTDPSLNWADNRFKVMHIDQTNSGTRTEKSNLFNDLQQWASAFKFDWQTITYAIVITRWTEPKATPIVRKIDLIYHTKDKTNNVYDIK